MSTVVARTEKVQVQYVGYFREPVFPVLEQPGRLCQSLLRYFVTVQALWNGGTDFVFVPFAVISYALGDEAGAHEAIAA